MGIICIYLYLYFQRIYVLSVRTDNLYYVPRTKYVQMHSSFNAYAVVYHVLSHDVHTLQHSSLYTANSFVYVSIISCTVLDGILVYNQACNVHNTQFPYLHEATQRSYFLQKGCVMSCLRLSYPKQDSSYNMNVFLSTKRLLLHMYVHTDAATCTCMLSIMRSATQLGSKYLSPISTTIIMPGIRYFVPGQTA